ncbi:glycoside hydrolase family 9 protein [Fodinibius salsisoli]|uniref:Endoglucanase n=1 Tax=Fodinibius salsisoli TaxID=2820877 RepID=A0ABT3PKX5_9BACT|nr:glycoside hydrolase family 9 protein [Fodinibius salsisoli]MCW9706510.1 glycoside hydrolase family 9 protein [Fodinibius salsisoli]
MVNRITKLLLVLLLSTTAGMAQKQNSEDKIRLNQVGFYPDAPKKAVVELDTATTFYVVNENTGERQFSAALGESRTSQYGGQVARSADFSMFSEPGSYRLFVPSIGYSHPFDIRRNIFEEAAKAGLKGYYFQRASTDLPREFAGKWYRNAGHQDDSVLVHESAATAERPTGTVISASKGWYDAGDYNKYIVNSGISMATLMSLYEEFPNQVRQIELNIPEQQNDIPDLLDEVRWNLQWMLAMQDPHDGGVYHKLTSAGFAGKVMPHQDRDKRYVVQKSTSAALNFAAVMAQASRVFGDYTNALPGLADSCLAAAREAWKWTQNHPNQIYDQEKLNQQFDPDITTGAYGDRNLEDEFRWAAVELYVTTGNERYLEAVTTIPDHTLTLPSWSQVGALGYYTLLRFKERLNPPDDIMLSEIKGMVIDYADQLVNGGKRMTYQTVMGYKPEHFIWGSNSVAGNQAILLIQAYQQTSNAKYWEAALSNLDYLLGRNATGYSFLTGYGDRTPMYPHHRPSAADPIEDPVPGLLVGGPNAGQQDGCEYPSNLPNQSYLDDWCSYASNEITINWNAPFVYTAFALEALNASKQVKQ